jgi:glycosyltransferase involved in cell wall biosynthesis
LRITFVLPFFATVPVGGLKVSYELAGRLARRGHTIVVVHADRLASGGAGLPARVRRDVRFAAWRRGFNAWFKLDSRVRAGFVDPRRPDSLPDADALVACGWSVAGLVYQAPPGAGRKHYFAQGYMASVADQPSEVDAAWRLPMRKIVISDWLAAKARELGGPSADVVRVSAAIDHEEFGVHTDPADRNPASVAMLHHSAPAKGAAEGLEALARVRATYPDLNVVLYGAQAPDHRLPPWANFVRQPPDLAGLYNAAAIFVHPSRLEGWGLPPAEAMACGCAVAAYANLGVREYGVHERNSLLVPIGDVAALAAAIERLICDRQLRTRLAHHAVADVATFTWDRSVAELESVLADSA